MPRRDGTGPLGSGPMTGRGLGNCISFGFPILAEAVAGFCFGKRRGWRNMFKSTGLTGWQRAHLEQEKDTPEQDK
ncbi:MAG: hypothetical protein A2104_01045 [Candidatus Melainabacteria bacterium GWF2_32_7]|nr:MAG: hypothetical protein A2104_01045 [Candidatus Melainabacteria bacterium GWF2_32_7]